MKFDWSLSFLFPSVTVQSLLITGHYILDVSDTDILHKTIFQLMILNDNVLGAAVSSAWRLVLCLLWQIFIQNCICFQPWWMKVWTVRVCSSFRHVIIKSNIFAWSFFLIFSQESLILKSTIYLFSNADFAMLCNASPKNCQRHTWHSVGWGILSLAEKQFWAGALQICNFEPGIFETKDMVFEWSVTK